MMTWWRENWRLYRIRCEIWSEINGIVNVTSFWVSSWDRGLLVPYLSLINKIFLVAKTVRLVMFLVQIIKKECLETFLTQETFSRLQISWYLEVEKFAFVAKGIVHDFYQRIKVSLPSLFSARLIKKIVWQCSWYKMSFLDQNKIDIRKLQNFPFLQRG